MTSADRYPQLPEVTPQIAEDYLRKARINWLTADDVLNNMNTLRKASAYAYAGDNPMQARKRETSMGGMGGAMQMLSGLYSADSAKFKAGDWIVIARRNRAMSRPRKEVLHALTMAADWRKTAAERTTQEAGIAS